MMKFNRILKNTASKSAVRKAGVITAGCVALSLAMPSNAKAQFGIEIPAILAALATLNSTMQAVMQVPMAMMQQVQSQMAAYEQMTIYPQSQIQASQASASQSLQSSIQIQNTLQSPSMLSSAQMPVTQSLETSMLSGDPNQINAVSSQFGQVYGSLPTSQQAPSQVVSVIDMGDAAAQESIKKAIQMDALATQELAVSQQLLTELQTAAPGNAPIISAQAAAWILQGHGYSQAAMAQILRAQSAELGYYGAAVKQGSMNNAAGAQSIFALKP
jgi:hypothetical protein